MIAELDGILRRQHAQWLVLDVGGVGYRVEVSARTQAALPPLGERVRLVIESYIREDQFRLFGFATEDERDWFSLLLGVPGVGAKSALAIQGQFSAAALHAMLAEGRAADLAQAPGVGKKLAARIVQELKDKVARAPFANADGAAAAGAPSPAEADALLALRKLGYQPSEAQRALAASLAAHEPQGKRDTKPAASELLRRALQELAR